MNNEVVVDNKYNKLVPEGTKFIDVYRVLDLFKVTDPCIQHAVKKLLMPGNRGAKSTETDVDEAMQSLVRYKNMRDEEKPNLAATRSGKSFASSRPSDLLR